jgi:hypothetical protein
MKHFGIVTLISVAASAAAPGSSAGHAAVTRETSRSVEQFGGCFVDSQDSAAVAWSYVPQSRGGTFSNFGARGARTPYFLAVLDTGPTRRVRLEAATAGSKIDLRVARAVDQCI